MDWKNKYTQCREWIQKKWTSFRTVCGVARDRAAVWLGERRDKANVWLGKTRDWLRRVWNQVNGRLTVVWNQIKSKSALIWSKVKVWLDKLCAKIKVLLDIIGGWIRKGDAWLEKLWARVKVYLDKVWAWIKKGLDFLGRHCKVVLGWLAVRALRVRKWVLKKTAPLRAWWNGWKGRKWLAEKADVVREKLPRPAPEQIQVIQELPEGVEQIPSGSAGEAVPRRNAAASKTPMGKVGIVLVAIWKFFAGTIVWIYRLRKYIMAIPVAYYAVKLAMANAERLPEMVGLDIQSNGEFSRMVTRQYAVLGPLGVTVFCLVLLLCSRKPLLPWLISIFTLILPVLIWMTNLYA